MKKPLAWWVLALLVSSLWVARDFLGTLVFAAFTVTTFSPLLARLSSKMNATLASLVLTLAIVVVIVAPLVVVGIVLTSRLAELVSEMMALWQSGNLLHALSSLVHEEVAAPKLGDLYREIARSVPGVLTGVGKVFFALSDLVIKSFLFVLLLYGLFARGRDAVGWLERSSPFEERVTRELMTVCAQTGRGILVGVFLVVVVHGVVATVGYLIVGIGRAVELGSLTALAGLVPAIGTGLVWVPLAVGLLATGHAGQALGVTIVGLVVGSVDNILRPWLSRLGKVPLPTLALFIAFFGGVTTFGAAGLLLGPLLFALAKASLELYTVARAEG